MFNDLRFFARPWVMIATCVLIYFVAFPDDMYHVTAPMTILFDVSNSVSPWLYVVIAVAIAASAMTKTWGTKRNPEN